MLQARLLSQIALQVQLLLGGLTYESFHLLVNLENAFFIGNDVALFYIDINFALGKLIVLIRQCLKSITVKNFV